MPHVVVEGPVSALRVHEALGPVEARAGGALLKVRESFLARSGKTALLDAVVVEGVTRRFLVEVVEREPGVTVRLFPLTDPEKTAGVKRLLALVALRVRALAPGSRLGATNLATFLAELERAGAGAGPGEPAAPGAADGAER